MQWGTIRVHAGEGDRAHWDVQLLYFSVQLNAEGLQRQMRQQRGRLRRRRDHKTTERIEERKIETAAVFYTWRSWGGSQSKGFDDREPSKHSFCKRSNRSHDTFVTNRELLCLPRRQLHEQLPVWGIIELDRLFQRCDRLLPPYAKRNEHRILCHSTQQTYDL